jgi:hypothetical protein
VTGRAFELREHDTDRVDHRGKLLDVDFGEVAGQ